MRDVRCLKSKEELWRIKYEVCSEQGGTRAVSQQWRLTIGITRKEVNETWWPTWRGIPSALALLLPAELWPG